MGEQRHAQIKLASEDEQIVWAEVYVPNVPDADGDYMDSEGIKKMSYEFMQSQSLRKIDVQHNNVECDACVVESFIARKNDPDFVEGAWVVGMYVADKEIWARIRKQEINSFSMESEVFRRPQIMEIEIPDVIRGMTIKADDGHEHEFYVSYSDEGAFRGGYTSKAEDGHSHVIKRGTITEETNGHVHRFSHVDNLVLP